MIPTPGQVNFPLNLFFSGSDPVLENRSIVLTSETVLEGWSGGERGVGALEGERQKTHDSNKYWVLF